MAFNFTNPSKLFAWLYSLFCPIYGQKFYGKFIETLELKGNEHILDFGSGAGILAKRLIKILGEEGRLTCLDTSSAFLNKVRRKLRKYDNVDYLLGDIRTLKIEPKSIDIIITSWVLHHIPTEDREEILFEFNKSLKSDGRIFIIEYCTEPHGISEDTLIRLFNNNSLKVVNKYRKKNTILIEFKIYKSNYYVKEEKAN